jgi:hypothetical protein
MQDRTSDRIHSGSVGFLPSSDSRSGAITREKAQESCEDIAASYEELIEKLKLQPVEFSGSGST